MTGQTLKNPSVILLPDPLVGIDAAIQRLQQSIGNLSWIEKSFGRAWNKPRTLNGKKVYEPMVYQGTAEYCPVLPNDTFKAYSFFRVNGARQTVAYNANLNTGGNYIFKDNVDLIVWCNLKAIDPSKDFIFTEDLIQQVMKKLNFDPNVSVVKVWDDKADEIFSGYTIDDRSRELLMYPYAAFRIEMQLSYRFECVIP